MKEGWQIYKLEDICTIYDKLRKPISKKDRVSGIYPYYGASCVQDYVNDYLFDGRYVLIGEDGAKWESGEDTAYIVEGKFWVNNHAHIIQCNNGIVDTFIYYYFNHLDLTKLVAGAIIPKLTQETLRSMEIPIPSFSEQQRIVALLDAEFAKIDALKANAEKNLQNAKDLFQAALKKELEPKEGWGKYRTDEVCVVSPSKSEVKKKNLKDVDWVSFLPMEDMTIGIKNVCPLQVKPFGEVSGSYTYFEDNDVLLAKVTPCFENGKLGITRNLKNGVGYGSSEFIVFRANSELVQPDYLYYCMQEPSFLKEGKKRMIGACGLKRLPKDFVKTRPLGIPSLTKQQSIVARLDVLSEKCKTLQANYEKTLSLCDDLKQALLRSVFGDDPVAIGTDAPVRPYGK